MTIKTSFNSGNASNEPGLRVRFSGQEDASRVLDFYHSNQHQHVDQRKDELWQERTENGRVIIVDDNEDSIGFVSVAYDYDSDDGIKFIELGSTMNQQDPDTKPFELIKGITLYPLIIASQVIHEFLEHTPEDKIIANLFDDNEAVIYMLNERCGWHFFDHDDSMQSGADATKGESNPYNDVAGDVWLEATTDTIPHQARMVLDFIEKAEDKGLFNKKSEKNISMDTSGFSLANEFRAAVEALASGPLAELLENNPHMGMAAARDLLEQHMQPPLQSPSAPGPQ